MQINRHNLKDGISLEEILFTEGVREGGPWIHDDAKHFLSRTYYDGRTKLEIDIAIGIPETNEQLGSWNDFDWALMLDEDFCQPYTPFYGMLSRGKEEDLDGFPALAFAVRGYNKFMDSVPFLERT